MKTGTLTAAGLLALAVGSAANAAMIVNTETTGAGVNAHTANDTLHLIQEVNFTDAFTLNSIAVNIAGGGFSLHLARNVGESASDALDIVWSANDVDAPDSYSWTTMDATGVEVEAGSYFLIMTSEIDGGARWRRVFRDAEGTEGVGVSGFATSGLDTITGKAFSTSVGERVYSVRIDGDVIPTPGAAALFGLAGITASRRRR